MFEILNDFCAFDTLLERESEIVLNVFFAELMKGDIHGLVKNCAYLHLRLSNFLII